MKAIIILETAHMLSNSDAARLREAWRLFAASGFTEPFIMAGGITAKVLYVPDGFTTANTYTPEEAKAILAQIISPGLVVM